MAPEFIAQTLVPQYHGAGNMNERSEMVVMVIPTRLSSCA
ncbi:hypothetical protein S2091_0747 [Solimicrobium silvestre]|uniref:Uncharacterized protein n=1 Tax=Solimicrobium silvestre TaxID=2099400 RepID=A0A2S9H430_9BURK|nr:hypothetical protein S2091_0747 [Solimicrobium silvestre]